CMSPASLGRSRYSRCKGKRSLRSEPRGLDPTPTSWQWIRLHTKRFSRLNPHAGSRCCGLLVQTLKSDARLRQVRSDHGVSIAVLKEGTHCCVTRPVRRDLLQSRE